jgi:Flp pilus assembly protein TadG
MSYIQMSYIKKGLKLMTPKRRQSGVGAVEVAISAGLMIIVVALAVDVTILNYAFTVNDAACRDAARAMAAQGDPTNGGNPLGAANAALKGHHTDGYLISQPALRTNVLNSNGDTLYPPVPTWGAANPPNTTPTVTCTTFVNVRLPVPLAFWGNNLGSAYSSNGGKIMYVRRYIFPVVNQSTN